MKGRLRIAAVFLFALAMIHLGLGAPALLDPDEGRNAEVAREMARSGRWLVPTYEGLDYLDKPAFFFRAVALAFSLFGESERTARLPSTVFAVGVLVLVFLLCRREYGEREGVLAVAVLASLPLFVVFARMVIFDMALTFFVCGAVSAGYVAEAHDGTRRRRWYALAACAAGMATLVKGPVGFLVPALVLLVFNAVDRRRGAAARLLGPVNLCVFLAVVLPWFLGVVYRRPDFAYYGLVRESFQRFTTASAHRTGPFYYFVPVIAGVAFAWSALLPESIVAAWRARERWSRADRLFIVWAVVVVVFFSLSRSKLPGYMLPAMIPLAALSARVFGLALTDPCGRAAALVRRAATVLALLGLAGAALLWVESRSPGAVVGLVTTEHRGFDRLSPLFAPVSVALGLTSLVALAARFSRRPRAVFVAFALFPVLLGGCARDPLLAFAERSSSRELARAVARAAPGAAVACLECHPNGLAFYLRRTVSVITRDGHELTSNYIVFALETQRPWPDTAIALAERDRWLDARTGDVFLLADARQRDALGALASARGADVVALAPGWWGTRISPVRER